MYVMMTGSERRSANSLNSAVASARMTPPPSSRTGALAAAIRSIARAMESASGAGLDHGKGPSSSGR